ncbi:DUF1697 domain-containing protein [Novosphingobium sp.]|uniref:DUF1697 domain-containing protein n=1 Tax=Novosphingobium sp. TaxID=1874826 RepID=UPI0035B3B0AD
MTGWAALLRAVNVGGNNKLPMAELKTLCEGLGLESVQTYIASGNVVFASEREEADLRTAIEGAIAARYGKRIGVLVRSASELARVTADNPFADCPGNRVVALFTDEPPSIEGLRHQREERLAAGVREIFVHYGNGMADSRLVIPAAANGTARNMNTVAKLAQLAALREA